MQLSLEALKNCGLPDDQASNILRAVSAIFASEKTMEGRWTQIRSTILMPEHPMSLHRLLCDLAFEGWDAQHGPRPIWNATETQKKSTHLWRYMQEKGFTDYSQCYDYSITQGRSFWVDVVRRLGIRFKNAYEPTTENIVDTSDPTFPKWLVGASLNISDSCFQADPNAIAIYYQREGIDEIKTVTFAELDRFANRVASALVARGFTAQDRLAIDMPFNIEAVAIYLGILKMGGTVISLADSFKAMDIDIRLEAAAPVKAVFTQDVTGSAQKPFPLYPVVIEAKLCPPAIVVTNDPAFTLKRPQDTLFANFLSKGNEKFISVALPSESYINVIFSSSTSSPKEKDGEKPKPPKAIPWKPHTAIKSAMDAHFHHDIRQGDVLCWPTNLGWMMGSFAIFGAFVNRAAMAIFDGNVVSAEFAKFVERTKVTMLGLVPTLSEGWEKSDATKGCDWSSIRCFSSTGSPSNPTNYFYLMSRVKGYAPCFEYMGGTEIGGGYLQCTFLHPAAPSCFTTPTLGTDMVAWNGEPSLAQKGEVFIAMRNGNNECPPMGLSTELLNFNHREKYFGQGMKTQEGYLLREHGDLVVHHPNGFITSNGRADDGINLNGIKTSSLDLENYIKSAAIVGVREVAAVAVRPPEGGEDWLVIYITKDAAVNASADAFKAPIREAIKHHNPQLARVHDVVIIEKMPLTASGKLRRRYLQDSYLEEWSGKTKAKSA